MSAPHTSPLIERLLACSTFPGPGVPLMCAVSGGADSSALLVLAAAAGCAVTAHHVDHGLRAESKAEAEVVAALAERFGAAFVGHTVRVDSGPNLEARARAARLGVLPADIATGHTMDDRAETVLLNLLRGAARSGLSPHTDRARHPIIGLRRSDTVALCAEVGIEPIQDPTNLDPAHQRNRVRHELLPLLTDIASRDLAPILDRQADLFADEDALLDELAGELDPTDARQLAAAHPALARRAIRNWITSMWDRDHPPGGESVERVLHVAQGRAVSTQIEGGRSVHRRDQRLRFQA
ncbi:MAG: tRNA lysidine(34) synthetase TilS [Actinomycetota bacterium]